MRSDVFGGDGMSPFREITRPENIINARICILEPYVTSTHFAILSIEDKK